MFPIVSKSYELTAKVILEPLVLKEPGSNFRDICAAELLATMFAECRYGYVIKPNLK